MINVVVVVVIVVIAEKACSCLISFPHDIQYDFGLTDKRAESIINIPKFYHFYTGAIVENSRRVRSG